LSFVTSNHIFHMYDIARNKTLYTKCLVKNQNSEIKIVDSKIVFFTYDIKNEDNRITSKVYSFGVYIEYEALYVLITFDLYFTNIEYKFNLKKSSNVFDLEELEISLGDNIISKNLRVSNLSGRLIDIKIMENKVWLITENKNQEYDLSDYDFSIWNLSSNLTRNYNNSAETTNIMDIINNRMSNNIRIINHIKTIDDLNTRINFLKLILRNSEIIPTENLIDYFSEPSKNANYTKMNLNQIYSNIEKMTNIKEIDLILERLFNKMLKNHIHYISSIKTMELESMCIVRGEGLSFIRKLGEMEQQEAIVTQHEYNLRKTVFEPSYFKLYIKNNQEALNLLKIKLSSYIMHKIKDNENNNFYIILALIRIYMTDIYLKLTDFHYVNEYFNTNHNDTNTFIKEHFYHYSSNLSNHKLSFTDLFHQIIFDLLLNQPKMTEMVSNWAIAFDVFTKSLYDLQKGMTINKKNEERARRTIFNSKFCEIMKNEAYDKINCLFKMNRDIFSFCNWIKNFSKFYKENLSFLNILPKIDKVKKMFFDSYLSFLLSNKNVQLNLEFEVFGSFYIFHKLVKTNESNMKFCELKMYENFEDNGYDFLQMNDNNSEINVLKSISSLWIGVSDFEQVDKYSYFYKIADKLISIVTNYYF